MNGGDKSLTATRPVWRQHPFRMKTRGLWWSWGHNSKITTGAHWKPQWASLRTAAETGRGFCRIQFTGEHRDLSMVWKCWSCKDLVNQIKYGSPERALPCGETAEGGIQIEQDRDNRDKRKNNPRGRKERRQASQSSNYVFDCFIKKNTGREPELWSAGPPTLLKVREMSLPLKMSNRKGFPKDIYKVI